MFLPTVTRFKTQNWTVSRERSKLLLNILFRFWKTQECTNKNVFFNPYQAQMKHVIYHTINWNHVGLKRLCVIKMLRTTQNLKDKLLHNAAK